MRPKIIFIIHYPPPVHGSAVVGGYIKESKLINDEFECRYINMGTSISIDQIGKGCRFYDRCAEKMDICMNSVPPLKEYSSGHICRCWLYEEV